jgi:hypothetical protein
MKVSTGYNPYAYRQQAGRGHSSRFADVYANRAANKSTKTGSAAGGVNVVSISISKVNTPRALNTDVALVHGLDFSKIKSQKIGVTTQAEFQDIAELIKSDGTDYELRGLSDDEKFAAIVKIFGGGATSNSFSQMVAGLHRNKLITREQADFLWELEMNSYGIERTTTESKQGYSFNLDSFNANYRVTMDKLLNEAARFKEFSKSIGQKISPLYENENYLRDFATKVDAAKRGF